MLPLPTRLNIMFKHPQATPTGQVCILNNSNWPFGVKSRHVSYLCNHSASSEKAHWSMCLILLVRWNPHLFLVGSNCQYIYAMISLSHFQYGTECCCPGVQLRVGHISLINLPNDCTQMPSWWGFHFECHAYHNALRTTGSRRGAFSARNVLTRVRVYQAWGNAIAFFLALLSQFWRSCSIRTVCSLGDATKNKYAAQSNCDLWTVGEEFSRKPYALAVQEGSPLRSEISSV